jgi:Ca-activated chloride channel family protein
VPAKVEVMDYSQDLYTILGISPGASEEEIRQAYRQAARRFHPDANNAPGAAVLFKQIAAAYEVLSDRDRRIEYDSVRHDTVQPSALTVEYCLSRETLPRLSEPQLLYALVKVKPAVQDTLQADAPLNLGIVVDRSTSMKGERLNRVKSAAHSIIDETNDDDTISVVSFADRAEVVVPADHPTDRRAMKIAVSTMRAGGATAIYSGLTLGLEEIERNHHPRYVNHLILITDGRTFGDEDACLALAEEARDKGIGISGMGIGEDWNDQFMDDLASTTGGSSAYIASPGFVKRFLEERIRSLATAYAERARLTVAPTPDFHLDTVFRVTPHPIALTTRQQPIPLGAIDGVVSTRLLLQFYSTTAEIDAEGEVRLGRLCVSGDVLASQQRNTTTFADLYVRIGGADVEVPDEPPPAELIEALSKLTLHRLQDRARQALDEGNVPEATRRLELLATRLFESGHEDLAHSAMREARRVAHTQQLSGEGTKHLKYGTRALLLPSGGDQ